MILPFAADTAIDDTSRSNNSGDVIPMGKNGIEERLDLIYRKSPTVGAGQIANARDDQADVGEFALQPLFPRIRNWLSGFRIESTLNSRSAEPSKELHGYMRLARATSLAVSLSFQPTTTFASPFGIGYSMMDLRSKPVVT